MKSTAKILMALSVLSACSTREAPDKAFYQMAQGRLPVANVSLNIPGLGPCTDNPDRMLHLDSSKPINVLVHGCFGSSGQFRALAQVFAFQGQQSACFTYDDRANLTTSATELRNAVNQLSSQTQAPLITVIGHSQGALIARKSLTELPLEISPSRQADLRLVTISGPFGGIASAETCGKTWLYPLTLGLLPLSCHLVTGEKWKDITYSSRFILEPGELVQQVNQYLKIDTDERNSCRRLENGRCVEDDFIFSMNEQFNPKVAADSRTKRVEILAGHVEIVGDKRVAPVKLISLLQAQGILEPSEPERQSSFDKMLNKVYMVGHF